MRFLYEMYITHDLVLCEPTCAIWENVALVGSYSTRSLCNIHQYFACLGGTSGDLQGSNGGKGDLYNNIFQFDPETQEWSNFGAMANARYAHALDLVDFDNFYNPQFCTSALTTATPTSGAPTSGAPSSAITSSTSMATSSTFSSTSITAASSTSSAQGTTKAPTISLVSSTTKATSSSAQGTTVGGLKRKGIFSWDYFLLHSFAYIMYFVKLGSCSYLLKCLNSNLNVSIQKQKEQS